MNYDYSKLKGRIIEKCGTLMNFAYLLGISSRALSLKLNNKLSWKQPEIDKAVALLNIKDKEIAQFFFNKKFKNTEQI